MTSDSGPTRARHTPRRVAFLVSLVVTTCLIVFIPASLSTITPVGMAVGNGIAILTIALGFGAVFVLVHLLTAVVSAAGGQGSKSE